MNFDDHTLEYLRGAPLNPAGVNPGGEVEAPMIADVPARVREHKTVKGPEEEREEKVELWMASIKEFIRAIDTQKL